MDCILCGTKILNKEAGEPYIDFKNKSICGQCGLDLIQPIFNSHTGGLAPIAFKMCLKNSKRGGV